MSALASILGGDRGDTSPQNLEWGDTNINVPPKVFASCTYICASFLPGITLT